MSKSPVKGLVEHKWLLALLASVLIALFVSPRLHLLSKQYKLLDYADRTIKAPRTLFVEDLESTKARKEEAVNSAPPVFDFDSTLPGRQKALIEKAFGAMHGFLGIRPEGDAKKGIGRASLITKGDMDEAEKSFSETLGLSDLSRSDFAYLVRSGYSWQIMDEALRIVDLAASKRIVADRRSFDAQVDQMLPKSRAIAVRDVATGKESPVADLDSVIDVKSFIGEVEGAAGKIPAAKRRRGQIGAKIALSLAGANLAVNLSETDQRREKAREAVLPSMVKLVKNQVIVAEGERITKDKLAVLNQIGSPRGRTNPILAFLSMVCLCFLLLTVLILFAEKNIRKFELSNRDLIFVGSIAVLTTFMIRFGVFLASAVSDTLGFLPESALVYALPIASSVMIVRILLNSEVALFYALLLSVFAGLLVGGDNGFTLYVLVGSFAGANLMRFVARRGRILRAGLVTGLFNVGAVLAIGGVSGITEDFLAVETLFNIAGAFLGGAACGLVVLAVLPLAETLFGYASNIKLLELASLNHPLLKEMVVRAPGTYNHCVVVSSLAEAGAEAIVANPLLAKVAGLYHDVGKINKPQYFLENQAEGENPHDTLFASMSTLILTAHVREGVDLARRYRLGERITGIIGQHHGTSLIRSFFKRAEENRGPDDPPIKQEDFRYPGPRPQTREAALVLLANVVEASSRTLSNPTPARLEKHLETVIDEVFIDGQLSECDLTLADLQKVSKAFLKVIAGFYHHRIEYPEQPPGASHPDRKLSIVDGSDS